MHKEVREQLVSQLSSSITRILGTEQIFRVNLSWFYHLANPRPDIFKKKKLSGIGR